MRLSLWPQSLFGRLIAASLMALLAAHAASLVLVARERERFVLQGSVREWSRRIAEVTAMLQGLEGQERAAAAAQLSERPWRFGHRQADVLMFRNGPLPPPDLEHGGPPDSGMPGASRPPREGPREELAGPSPLRAEGRGPARPVRGPGGPPPGPPEEGRGFLSRVASSQTYVPIPLTGDFERTFEQQLQSTLGTGFRVKVSPATDPAKRAISITGPLFAEGREGNAQPYDVAVGFPDGYEALFRVTRMERGAPLPRGLLLNLSLLVTVMSIVLFITARSITRPLSELERAADSVGRDLRQPRLEERGARELRHAARAFNTMQDRLQRYLDSRSRVLAAMSHDLKTPLTRLRLQVEILDDPAVQARIGKQLDEMESMVRGALALFRGLDDDEAFSQIDINDLLATLKSEFAEMSAPVTIEGHALKPISGKPQALRRCLTNLIANAVKFGTRATLVVEDGASLVIHVRDDGPGIPTEELERVFEPFYRVESSRNRDTGGTGLGLSIARDVVQAHGGSLVLRNLPVRGLEAILTLPRA
ncbi:MAG TPA: HAMP domain-containing sensor histidine kinase [Steroidobacteraceae bacterium]|nr:HAMP domain-containing sensor histidine kinase [Steroidobacteraceae bacterium]